MASRGLASSQIICGEGSLSQVWAGIGSSDEAFRTRDVPENAA
jgi:hypothetical protein